MVDGGCGCFKGKMCGENTKPKTKKKKEKGGALCLSGAAREIEVND